MLIDFKFKNFMSFADECNFTMLANKDNSHSDDLISFGKDRASKVRLIYGANASGKTSFINAMYFISSFIANSNMLLEKVPIQVVPFKFCDNCFNTPSEFAITFIKDGLKYAYSFSCTREKVIDERLDIYYSAKPTMIFNRFDTNNYEFNKDAKILNPLKERNLDNKLFLVTTASWNYEKTKPVVDYLLNTITVMDIDVLWKIYLDRIYDNNEQEEYKAFCLKILNNADISISDFKVDPKKLKDVGIGTYILFQETYHKDNYEVLHPTGPKHDYAYHTEAMDRAMTAGIDDVGIGVLFGLDMYRYDFAGLLMHAEHLEAKFGVGPHTISVPRIRPADDIDPDDFENAINDDIFEKIVAILRIAVPYTGIIVSTRETQESRERVLKVGVSQISGASSTSVGGYAEKEKPEDNSAQFEKNDNRTLDEIIGWLMDLGHIPSFCTACYREGRTGDRFMTLVKSGQIANCCAPNALMTLKEYLEDYASDEVKAKGEVLIKQELEKIPNPVVKQKATEYIENIHEGKRDFRF